MIDVRSEGKIKEIYVCIVGRRSYVHVVGDVVQIKSL